MAVVTVSSFISASSRITAVDSLSPSSTSSTITSTATPQPNLACSSDLGEQWRSNYKLSPRHLKRVVDVDVVGYVCWVQGRTNERAGLMRLMMMMLASDQIADRCWLVSLYALYVLYGMCGR